MVRESLTSIIYGLSVVPIIGRVTNWNLSGISSPLLSLPTINNSFQPQRAKKSQSLVSSTTLKKICTSGRWRLTVQTVGLKLCRSFPTNSWRRPDKVPIDLLPTTSSPLWWFTTTRFNPQRWASFRSTSSKKRWLSQRKLIWWSNDR